MTSLIDVIFLLLLFFMLTSTFSRFGEIPITLGGAGQATSDEPARVLLRLTADGPRLNGQPVKADALAAAVTAQGSGTQVLVSAAEDADAQGLADVLNALRGIEDAQIVVLQ